MKYERLLKSILGDDAYESLSKALVKLGTKSVVDITEMHDALKTAPKSVLAFLVRELKGMEKDETREIEIPWADNAQMTITKLDSDVYKGTISKDSKVIHEFHLTAIPQLATHLMSSFEIYDEEAEKAAPEKSNENEELREQIRALDGKINALMVLISSQSVHKSEKISMDRDKFIDEHKNLISTLESPSHDDDKKEAKEQKRELKEVLDKASKIGKLKKAGLAPTMPKPPKAGTKVGGMQGKTKAGLHGDKTEHSDLNTAPVTQSKINPYLKAPKGTSQPKQPKQPKLEQSEKTITFKKSELESQCSDCGQSNMVNGKVVSCACFRALSLPEIKKSEGENVTLKLKNDWDSESVSALYHSLVKNRKHD